MIARLTITHREAEWALPQILATLDRDRLALLAEQEQAMRSRGMVRSDVGPAMLRNLFALVDEEVPPFDDPEGRPATVARQVRAMLRSGEWRPESAPIDPLALSASAAHERSAFGMSADLDVAARCATVLTQAGPGVIVRRTDDHAAPDEGHNLNARRAALGLPPLPSPKPTVRRWPPREVPHDR